VLGEATHDRLEGVSFEESFARRGLLQVLDNRQARELVSGVGEPQRALENADLSVDGPVRRAGCLSRLGVVRDERPVDCDESPTREELVEVLEAVFGLIEPAGTVVE
jgi:hypothetical protein